MADLPLVGAQAILQDIEKFLSDTQRFVKALEQAGQSTQKVSDDAQKSAAGAREMNQAWKDLGAGMSAVGGMMTAAGAALTGLTVVAMNAAGRYDELGVAMNQTAENSGYTSGQMATLQEQLQKLGLSASGSREFLLRLMQSEIDLGQATQLARAAQDLAVIGMTNSTETANDLAYAISSLNVRILRKYGIVGNLIPIIEQYGASMGLTGDELKEFTINADENAKRQAMLNYVLQAAGQFTGVYEAAMTSASKQMRSLTGREIPDLVTELGSYLQPAFLTIVQTAREMIAEFRSLPEGMKEFLTIGGAVTGVLLTMAGGMLLIVPRILSLVQTISKIGPAIQTLISGGAIAGLALNPVTLALMGVAAAAGVATIAFAAHAAHVAKLKAETAGLIEQYSALDARIKELLTWQDLEKVKMLEQHDAYEQATEGVDAYTLSAQGMATSVNDLSDAEEERIRTLKELLDTLRSMRADADRWQGQADEYAEKTKRDAEVAALFAEKLHGIPPAADEATGALNALSTVDVLSSFTDAAAGVEDFADKVVGAVREVDSAAGMGVGEINELVGAAVKMAGELQSAGTAVPNEQLFQFMATLNILRAVIQGSNIGPEMMNQFLQILTGAQSAAVGILNTKAAYDQLNNSLMQHGMYIPQSVQGTYDLTAAQQDLIAAIQEEGTARSGVDNQSEQIHQREMNRLRERQDAARIATQDIEWWNTDQREFIADNEAQLTEELKAEFEARREAAYQQALAIKDQNAQLATDLLDAERDYQEEKMRIVTDPALSDEERAAKMAILDRENQERVQRLQERAALEQQIEEEKFQREIEQMRTAGAAGGEAMSTAFLDKVIPALGEMGTQVEEKASETGQAWAEELGGVATSIDGVELSLEDVTGTPWVLTVDSNLGDAKQEAEQLEQRLTTLADNPYTVEIEFDPPAPPEWAQPTSPKSRLQKRLEMLKQWADTNTIQFHLETVDEGGEPPAEEGPGEGAGRGEGPWWTRFADMKGLMDFGSKISSFANYIGGVYKDKILGPFEEGLAALDDEIESIQKDLEDGGDDYEKILGLGAHLADLQAQRNILADEYNAKQAELLKLQEQQRQYDFLKQQLDLVAQLQEAGIDPSEILGGITLGLDASVEDLVKAMQAAMQALIEAADKELEAGSPSRAMARRGRWVMQGLGLGIAEEVSTPAMAMRAAADSLANPFLSMMQSAPWGGGYAGADASMINNSNNRTLSANNTFNIYDGTDWRRAEQRIKRVLVESLR